MLFKFYIIFTGKQHVQVFRHYSPACCEFLIHLEGLDNNACLYNCAEMLLLLVILIILGVYFGSLSLERKQHYQFDSKRNTYLCIPVILFTFKERCLLFHENLKISFYLLPFENGGNYHISTIEAKTTSGIV